MEFKNRERQVANKRKITISKTIVPNAEYEVLIDEVQDNIVSEGTPITAELMQQIYNKAENVAKLEANVGKIVYDSNTDTFNF